MAEPSTTFVPTPAELSLVPQPRAPTPSRPRRDQLVVRVGKSGPVVLSVRSRSAPCAKVIAGKTVTLKAGVRTLRLAPRLGGRTLRPGSYLLTLTIARGERKSTPVRAGVIAIGKGGAVVQALPRLQPLACPKPAPPVAEDDVDEGAVLGVQTTKAPVEVSGDNRVLALVLSLLFLGAFAALLVGAAVALRRRFARRARIPPSG